MLRPTTLVACGLALLPCCSTQTTSLAPDELSALSLPAVRDIAQGIEASTIQEHVDLLASDAMAGRWAKGPEARIAAQHIAELFGAAGLLPAGDDASWFQALDDAELSPNVVAVLPGRGPDWVVIGAHYDHLKPRNKGSDRIFNGADDNASGVAGVLELAQAFGALPQTLNASVVFVAFTGEELGLLGSRFFVDHPPAPLQRLRAAVNLDMIGRGNPGEIFCEGGADSPWLRALTDRANLEVGLRVRHDEHPEWARGSDHYHFMKRSVPTLYFGVEDHADYHRVSDHADLILPELSAAVARLVFWITLEVASTRDS